MILLFLILQALDAILSAYLLTGGYATEANPIADIIFREFGVFLPIVLIKVATSVFIIAAIERTYYPIWVVVNLVMFYVVASNLMVLANA
jgi:Domain of unknown function (DUF5658)